MKESRLIFALFILFLATPKGMADTVTLATLDWSPFYGKDLPKKGYIAEIARQALERKGHKMTLEFMPWTRAMYTVKQGVYHGLFGCWFNNEIKDDYYFSKEIMGSGDGHFLALDDSVLHSLVPEKLKGKKVGFVRGYPISDELIKLFKSGQVSKHEISKFRLLFGLIWAGRIDVILENYQVAKHYFKQSYPEKTFDLKIVGKDYVDAGLYICWSKKKKGINQIIQDFDDSIRTMRKDGTINKIEKEFGIN